MPGPYALAARSWIERLCLWDSNWYVEIARQGYAFDPHGASSVGFYPLYPLLIRALMRCGLDPLLAGYAISHAALFAAAVWMWRLAALGNPLGDDRQPGHDVSAAQPGRGVVRVDLHGIAFPADRAGLPARRAAGPLAGGRGVGLRGGGHAHAGAAAGGLSPAGSGAAMVGTPPGRGVWRSRVPSGGRRARWRGRCWGR